MGAQHDYVQEGIHVRLMNSVPISEIIEWIELEVGALLGHPVKYELAADENGWPVLFKKVEG